MVDVKPQVLLVDDSNIDIQIALECLRDEFKIAVALSGREAIDMLAAKKIRPKVIVLDVCMPELDGYETCRQIKANSETQNTEVIFVSANSSIEEKLLGYDAGGQDFLVKPIAAFDLLQKVRLAVERSRER